MSSEDRLTGLRSGAAVKVPVKCVTSAAITLSGEQTVNGTACVTDDRVLVKDQASGVNNGIYIVDTGAWSRAPDFDGSNDVITGTMVFSVAQLKFYYVTTTGDITIGTTSIAFSQAPIDTSGASAYFATLFSAADAAALRALEGQTRIDYATAGGTVDAITAAFTVTFASLDQTALIMVQCGGENTSTTPTLKLDSLTAKTIIKGSNQALVAGDIAGADFLALFRYDTSLDKFQLLNPASGVSPVSSSITAVGQNIGATVTLAANAMTFDLKGANGSDPSASNPVDVYFQSATLTTGTATKRTITAATGITIASTATGGTIDSVPSRIYFGLLDNAGTVELCWWNALSLVLPAAGAPLYTVVGMFSIDEGQVYTTVANTTGSDSAMVIYSTSARTNVRVIPIAYVDSDQATAGTWATAIAGLTLIGPNTAITGDVIQESTDYDGAVATGTTVVPMDDTVPDPATDGDIYLTVSLTRKTENTVLEIEYVFNGANSAATDGFVAYLSDNIYATQASNIVAAGDQVVLAGKRRFMNDAILSMSIDLLAGGGAAGTTTFNGRAGGRLYGGTMGSYLTVREIAA